MSEKTIVEYMTDFGNMIEYYLRQLIIFITNFLPVKVIRDDHGRPFLYRYHLFSLSNDGPGMCIHHFVKSDPDRGYHDHPWEKSISFILAGKYDERILNDDKKTYETYIRNRWTFNYLDGKKTFHRVMIEDDKDVWTLFYFQKRSKIWGMISLNGIYQQMSNQIKDNDGGWWNWVQKGLGIHSHLDHKGKVVATVDIIVINKEEDKVLLIKRGKNPYKNHWVLPGGRIEQKDENILSAAYRELLEETNISERDIELKYMTTIGNNSRDPRGFCLTNVFVGELENITDKIKIRAGDDAVDYQWLSISSIKNNEIEMGFDHGKIINDIL